MATTTRTDIYTQVTNPIVCTSTFKKNETADDGSEVEAEIPFLKQYTVLMRARSKDCKSISMRWAERPQETFPRIERAETFFANTKADIHTGSDRACYVITHNYIRMPLFECFQEFAFTSD